MSYNGWTNYETWNVKLWIDNEPGLYEEFKLQRDEDFYILAQRIQSYIEEYAPEVTGMYADLLNHAILEVNWREIAESIIEDNEEETETGKEL